MNLSQVTESGAKFPQIKLQRNPHWGEINLLNRGKMILLGKIEGKLFSLGNFYST